MFSPQNCDRLAWCLASGVRPDDRCPKCAARAERRRKANNRAWLRAIARAEGRDA